MPSLGADNNVKILIEIQADGSGITDTEKQLLGLNHATDESSGKTGLLSGAFEGFGKTVAAVGAAFAGYQIIQKVQDFGAMAVNSAAELQQTSQSFQVLIGNTQVANTLFAQLATYANTTPFEFADISKAGKTLLGFGIEAKDVMKTTQNLGDISAVTGANLGSLATVYGQVVGAGKMQAQDWHQLINMGIPINQMLQKVGVNTANLGDIFQKGGVDLGTFQAAFTKADQAGSFAFNGTTVLASSFNGRMSTLKDTVANFGRELIGVHIDPELGLQIKPGGIFDMLSKFVLSASNELQKFAPQAQAAGTALMAGFREGFLFISDFVAVLSGEGVTSKGIFGDMERVAVQIRRVAMDAKDAAVFLDHHRVIVAALGGAIMGVLVPAFIAWAIAAGAAAIATITAFAPVAIAAVAAAAPFILIGAAVGALAYLVVTHFSQIKAFITQVMNDVVRIWQGVAKSARDTFGAVENFFKAMATGMKTAVTAVGNAIATAFMWVLNNVIKPVFEAMMVPVRIWAAVVTYEFDVIRGLALVTWWAIYNTAVKPALDAMGTAMHWFSAVASSVWNAIVTGVNWASGVVTAVWGAIAASAAISWNWLWGNAISPVINAITAAAKWAGGVVVGVWNWISSVASATWGAITGWVGSMWDKLTGGAGAAANSVSNAFSGVAAGIKNVFSTAINWIVDKINTLIHAVNNSAGRLPGVPKLSDIPHLYTGVQNFGGGLAVVGDVNGAGGELISLPQGSSVYSNHDSRKMMGGTQNHFHGDIYLGDQSAVNEFFKKLNRNNELARRGLTTAGA